jgi:hypothetical protein
MLIAASATSRLETATSTATSSEPPTKPTLSSVLQQMLAAASSRGERESCGISAACAGLCAVPAMLISAASARTTANGAPAETASAAPAARSARVTPPAISISLREWRSASIEAYGAASTDGAMRTSTATPTARAPPSP